MLKYINFQSFKKKIYKNLVLWYKNLEIINLFFKKYYYNIQLLISSSEFITREFNNENLYKLLLLNDINDKDKATNFNIKIFYNKLDKYSETIKNLPFFEFYIIKLLRLNKKIPINIIDIICLNDDNNIKYYPNCFNFYIYEHLPIEHEINNLLNRKFYSNYINIIRKYFEINEKIDVIILSHYKTNKQLTKYFEELNNYLNIKKQNYRLIFEENVIKSTNINNLFIKTNSFKISGCLLRNTNENEKLKTIFAFKQNEKQYIIYDDKIETYDWIDDDDFIDYDIIKTDDDGFTYTYNFALGDKLLIYINNTEELIRNKHICTSIDVIPQFSGTCWFNSILTALFYSQYSRKILFKESKEWDTANNSLLKTLKTILYESYNYINKEKIQKLYKKIKPETILIKYLSKYDEYFKNKFKKLHKKTNFKNYEFKDFYMIKFLNDIGLDCLDIIYYKKDNIDYFIGNYIKNIFTNIEINNKKEFQYISPNYIILFHNELDRNGTKCFFNLWEQEINKDNYILNNNIDIINYKNIIRFNGHKYKLDSVLLSNFNHNAKNYHTITGITCNNNKYVYNGWNKCTNDIAKSDINANINPCPLMPYQWDLHKHEIFTLNSTECKLDIQQSTSEEDELYFSFNKGNRILIYAKIIDEEQIKPTLISTETNSISGLNSILEDMYDLQTYTRKELKNNLRANEYTDFANKTDDDLRKILKEIIYKHHNVKPRKSKSSAINPDEIELEMKS